MVQLRLRYEFRNRARDPSDDRNRGAIATNADRVRNGVPGACCDGTASGSSSSTWSSLGRGQIKCVKLAFSCWTLSNDWKWLIVDSRTTRGFAVRVDLA